MEDERLTTTRDTTGLGEATTMTTMTRMTAMTSFMQDRLKDHIVRWYHQTTDRLETLLSQFSMEISWRSTPIQRNTPLSRTCSGIGLALAWFAGTTPEENHERKNVYFGALAYH